MPKVKVNDITMNYESQGSGEPLVLIPYLAADHACYAFQVADYAKHFTCISVDPRGAGETDKPAGAYSTAMFADDIAAFMQAIGVERAHVSGLSLGAAVGLWLAGKHPQRVKSLSLHSAWDKTDPYLKVVVEGWRTMARGLPTVTDMVIQGILPWCFTPELYAAKPEFIEAVAAFVRGRPVQPLDAFLRQSDAVIAHDAQSQLANIRRADADHLRSARRRDFDPLRRPAEQRDLGKRTGSVRKLRARADLREHRRIQRKDVELPQAPQRLTAPDAAAQGRTARLAGRGIGLAKAGPNRQPWL